MSIDSQKAADRCLIRHASYRMTLNGCNGSLESFANDAKELILPGADGRPLFAVRFRDPQGRAVDLNAHQAESFVMSNRKTETGVIINMEYGNIGGNGIHADVRVECPNGEPFTYWHLSVENDTDLAIEWIDFPDVVVPNDLASTGGRANILWPVGEGVLVDDADLRENSWLNYKPLGYPSKGWDGYFPCSAQTQFMAYYDDAAGLYIGAHDEQSHVKMLEFRKYADGIRLEHRVFAEAAGRGTFRLAYPVVIGMFHGDWHDAADIYRSFYQSAGMPRPPKLFENKQIPEWLTESPVVVTYPVRGEKDTGPMHPNEDYYPYTNALPFIDRLARDFDSNIMALLMQWEGTAPWAPPYVWPPYGDEENFVQFIHGLHEAGHLAGVYASGIAWTNESLLEPQYNRKREFDEQRLADAMCVSPEGELLHSLICNGNIRWGHDICVATGFAEQVVGREIAKLIESGCDYIQYFDQMHGGGPCFCYGAGHGHPPGPGKWMKDSMERLLRSLHEQIRQSGKPVVLGCESAAAEPYIPYLMFNDVRFELNYMYGTPVPLYTYLYHEYINNFMGNQNCASASIDLAKSPYNLLQRLAYSFAAGDMFTVVLKDRGIIHWDWCLDWEVPEPEQAPVKTLIRNLNTWRKHRAKPYLVFGRMEKPLPLEGAYAVPMIMKDGRRIDYPSLMTSRWTGPQGKAAQIIVNYMPETQTFSLPALRSKPVRVSADPYGEDTSGIPMVDGGVRFDIAPLSAMLVEFEP